ncbi:MAG: hypothetical protein GFH27_549333n13 [Chloroflexi bacterium AL-W]|nr:hypothetical protein [Chloroflexi bacterium AL-N1]NOK70534.1 hypothetical protein [Chloroflexi bacterium AL-N10]NOK78107.1 hypothetical protein [Chloroflexi bacterium AL-N5]NOK85206.1 hypothetical protein [Chloroflexi bacterium AL-W]NOK91971.1 hypothetical protein [Chloroflexi bacterium AL-N15]
MQSIWELTLLDAAAPVSAQEGLTSLAVGDIDQDGYSEMFIGGDGALLWYRPATQERGVIACGLFAVGLILEDVNGNDQLSLVGGSDIFEDGPSRLFCFTPTGPLSEPWDVFFIDPAPQGSVHDLLFADIDGDGERELIANACYSARPGLFIYKRTNNIRDPWQRYTIQAGKVEEGLAVSDFNHDGRLEIASGVRLYLQPEDGPYDGPWPFLEVAPDKREMCRVAAVDITGNGRDDLVIIDSEYLEGTLSWFENRMIEDPSHPWVEHLLDTDIYYGHTLIAQRDQQSNEVCILLAEMAGGGWNPPYNFDAQMLEYRSTDNGATWQRELLYRGAGTHEATLADIDGDGIAEIAGKEWRVPKVHFFKQTKTPSPNNDYQHRFIDRDKGETASDILAVDVDGDGREDVVCGSWWYHNPSWERYPIPGICQVINTYDIDGDGRMEFIATKRNGDAHGYAGLSSDLCWLKPIDPFNHKWTLHEIGVGTGDWPHGSAIAPLLPNGGLALITTYHSAHAQPDADPPHYPELWVIPPDLTHHPWEKRVLAPIIYGEEITACDVNGNGHLDLIAGCWWLQNNGDSTFTPHTITEDFYPARLGLMDINNDGRIDVILGQEVIDFTNRQTPWSQLAWFEQPDDPTQPWTKHVIDTVRCAHSLSVADLDGDGEEEIICGEHHAFAPYRSQSRLLVYKKADPLGHSWKRYTLDNRFEHHDGAKIIQLDPERIGIISHSWYEPVYVHLWSKP